MIILGGIVYIGVVLLICFVKRTTLAARVWLVAGAMQEQPGFTLQLA
jgi:hypothetical protein